MKQHAFVPSSSTGSAAPKGSTRMIVFLTAAIAALGGLLFGYDTSVISGAMLFLRTDFHLTDVQLEFAVGIALAGALVGAGVAGYCADHWGRRATLLGTGVGFGGFAILSGLATGLVTFSTARFFVGLCIGVASLVTPLYLAEMSPARIRGALVSLNQLAITIGIWCRLLCRLRTGLRAKLALDVSDRSIPCVGAHSWHDIPTGKPPMVGAGRISRPRSRWFPPARPW